MWLPGIVRCLIFDFRFDFRFDFSGSGSTLSGALVCVSSSGSLHGLFEFEVAVTVSPWRFVDFIKFKAFIDLIGIDNTL